MTSAPTADARYFYVNDFTGDSVSYAFQTRFEQQRECDVLIRDRRSPGEEVRAHSQVLVSWSRRFSEIVQQTQEKRLISPEKPLVASISSQDFTSVRLLIEMMYYGSRCVPCHVVPEMQAQAAKLGLQLHEREAVVTPATNKWSGRRESGDSGFASLVARRALVRRKRVIVPQDLRLQQEGKRKREDRASHDEEDRTCKRIRKKSDETRQHQIQLSPGSCVADHGSDLLNHSIVPTIDSD